MLVCPVSLSVADVSDLCHVPLRRRIHVHLTFRFSWWQKNKRGKKILAHCVEFPLNVIRTDFWGTPPSNVWFILAGYENLFHTPTHENDDTKPACPMRNGKQFKTQPCNKTKRMINVVVACYHSLREFYFFIVLCGCEHLDRKCVGRAEIKVLKRGAGSNIWNSVTHICRMVF
jgi:hypothetical protein